MKSTLEKARKLLSPAYRMQKLYKGFSPTGGPLKKGGGKKVLFIPWYSRELYFLRETFIAKACEFRGATTALLHCDVRIAPTENGTLAKRYGIKNPEINGGEEALKHLQQNQLKASDFFQPLDRVAEREKLARLSSEQIEAFSYRNIKVGDLVIASTIRNTLGMGPEWAQPSFREYAQELMLTCMELIDLFYRVFQDFKPDEVVMSHGLYVTWGTAFRVARELGINVTVYGASYRKNTIRFYHNAPNAPFPLADWPDYREIKLTPPELKWCNNYAKSRLNLDEENFDLFEGAEDPEKLIQFIQEGKDNGQKLAALFTNMSWDAYAFSDHSTFEGMVDWANRTLEYIRNKPELRLIFKVHPAEDFFNVPEKYRIKNHLMDIPDNVLLLSEKDKIRPALFYSEIDFGIINISTVAIEMALMDIPVLTSGANGHYEGNGFTISPDGRQDYFDKLDALIDSPGQFMPNKEMANRYLFYRFYREALEFEPLKMNGFEVEEITINSYEDLKPGKLPGLDIIAEGIMNGTPFLRGSELLIE